MRLLSTLATAAAGLALAASTDHVAPATSAPATLALPVTVTNTQPIPTQVQGTANVAGTVSLAAGTQVGIAGGVTIANDQPLATHEVEARHMVTVSARVVFNGVGNNVAEQFPTPTCPAKTQFLVTEVSAAPIFNDAVSLGHWTALLGAVQYTQAGGGDAFLMAWGNGPVTATASIPGGQPLPSNGLAVEITFADVIPAAGTAFIVHASGYCGVPNVGAFEPYPFN